MKQTVIAPPVVAANRTVQTIPGAKPLQSGKTTAERPAAPVKKTMQPVNNPIAGSKPKPRRVRKHAGSDSSLDSIRSGGFADNTVINENDLSAMHYNT